MFELSEDICCRASKSKAIVDKVRHVHCKRDTIRDEKPDRQPLLKAGVEPIIQWNDEQQDEQNVRVQYGRQVELQSAQH